MAKVNDIIFCLKANNLEGAGVSATNILTAINPEYVPGLFSFSIIVTFVDVDFSNEHSISVELLDPECESVLKAEGPIPVLEDKSNIPNEYKGLNMAMELNNVNFKR